MGESRALLPDAIGPSLRPCEISLAGDSCGRNVAYGDTCAPAARKALGVNWDALRAASLVASESG
jgi:hypothetical protein